MKRVLVTPIELNGTPPNDLLMASNEEKQLIMLAATSMTDLAELATSIVIVGTAIYALFRWLKSQAKLYESKPKEGSKTACGFCGKVFFPKFEIGKKTRKGHVEYATCPQCDEENEFEVDDD